MCIVDNYIRTKSFVASCSLPSFFVWKICRNCLLGLRFSGNFFFLKKRKKKKRETWIYYICDFFNYLFMWKMNLYGKDCFVKFLWNMVEIDKIDTNKFYHLQIPKTISAPIAPHAAAGPTPPPFSRSCPSPTTCNFRILIFNPQQFIIK